ncbi:MAG: hypothetical protein U0V73_06700 [Acidimicrobiia bacterium]
MSESAITDPGRYMFVRDFVHVDQPMETVRRRFLDSAEGWLSPIATRAAPCDVVLEIGPARLRDDAILLPMAWSSSSASSFPSMLADLEIAPVGEHRTHISFNATYETRRAGLGRRGDELLLHRFTEASVRQFLMDVADVLRRP